MRIAFVDMRNWDYLVESVHQIPLPGSQSALCCLCESLANLGHEIFLINNVPRLNTISCGVICLSLQSSLDVLKSVDFVVILNLTGGAGLVKSHMAKYAKLILWTQDDVNQGTQQSLKNECDVYDGFALVSNWQSERFQNYFGISQNKIGILLNAVNDCMFVDEIVEKERPVLAYTSAPHRGLDVLLTIFPKIKNIVPEVILKVFSDVKGNTLLYEKCKTIEGVQYVGPISQPKLSQELKFTSVFVYPSIFAETSCISVMDAMASGCWIVASDLGALKETTAGFAKLISMKSLVIEERSAWIKPWSATTIQDKDWQIYIDEFSEEVVKFLKMDSTVQLKKQIDFASKSYNWSIRVHDWVDWLNSV